MVTELSRVVANYEGMLVWFQILSSFCRVKWRAYILGSFNAALYLSTYVVHVSLTSRCGPESVRLVFEGGELKDPYCSAEAPC